MDTPDSIYVRRRSQLDWDALGFTAPEDPDVDPDPLDDEVGDAVEYVEGVTWRKLDSTMPVEFARRAARAAWLRTEQQVQQEQEDPVEAASDELFISSSAGGASETRRGFADYKSANEALLVNKWPALNDLLWSVMTPEAQAWWRAFLTGAMPGLPASVALGGFMVLEVAWDAFHATPYEDVIDPSAFRSTYFAPVDPGDLPLVQDPYSDGY